MSKIKSFNELKDFADKLKPILYMRENHTKENPEKREILVSLFMLLLKFSI